MATLKVKNLKNVERAITRNLRVKVNKIFRDKSLRSDIGDIVAADIKKQSLGTPAPATLRWRKLYQQYNKTDPKYKQNKINITFTGELLKDLSNNVKAIPTKKSFEIKQSEKLHKKYKGKSKLIGKKRSKYSDIQDGLESLGYDYLNIRDKAKSDITKKVRQRLFELLT